MVDKKYILEFNEKEMTLIITSLIFHSLFFKGELDSLIDATEREIRLAKKLEISSDLDKLVKRLTVL
jgi:hypothetical protein